MKSGGKTFAEKALTRGARLPEVLPGQIVDVYPDLYMSNTASWRCIRTLEKMGTEKLYDLDRIAMVMDHISPAREVKNAVDQRLCREFAAVGARALALAEAKGLGHEAPTEWFLEDTTP